MDQTQLLRIVAGLLAQRQGAQVQPGAQAQPGAGAAASPLQGVLAALLARSPAGTAAPPLLSPIDKWLGGQTLAGKKTAIAVVGFAILAIINPGVLAGGAVAGVAPQIVATLLKAFGGLGLLAKVDRVIQSLGLIAAAPGTQAATGVLVRRLLAALAAQAAMQPKPEQPPAPPQPRPPDGVPAGKTVTVSGRMSTFGGPADTGVSPIEGLALIEPAQLAQFADCFLAAQPPGTSGLARRLDPEAAYIACRWNYRMTPKQHLRAIKVEVINPQTGQKELAQPVDWGPNKSTGRVADLSPGLATRLGLKTDESCTVVIPL